MAREVRNSKPEPALPSRIFLVGFMGCGKTTVGRLLAQRLARRFIDLDEQIVNRAGKPITQIFADDGEDAFRHLESVLLRDIMREENVVIGMGGGAFVAESNRRLMRGQGVTIWLHCSFDVILMRLEGCTKRPLNRTPDDLRRLFESRLGCYSKADFRIDSSRRTATEVADEILRILGRKGRIA